MGYWVTLLASFFDPFLIIYCGLGVFLCRRLLNSSKLAFLGGLFGVWLIIGLTRNPLSEMIVDGMQKPNPAAHLYRPDYDPWVDIVDTPFEKYSEEFAISGSPEQTADLKRWVAATKIRRSQACVTLEAASPGVKCDSIRIVGSIGASAIWVALLGFVAVWRNR